VPRLDPALEKQKQLGSLKAGLARRRSPGAEAGRMAIGPKPSTDHLTTQGDLGTGKAAENSADPS